MKLLRMQFLALAAALVSALAFTPARAAEIPPSLTTPDKVETRIGPLEFKDGMPSKDTIAKIYDNGISRMRSRRSPTPFRGSAYAPFTRAF